MGDNMHMEVQEDDEEDDIDFNPHFRGETPSEASSSLSSENDEHIQSSLECKINSLSSKPVEKIEIYSHEVVNEGEETIMQVDDAPESSIKQLQRGPTRVQACNEGVSVMNGNACANVPTMKILAYASSTQETNEPIVYVNDDAICRRTRARHSLANYTLEELETFLQESDDDDDLHNVDDEEEYHKFLAAVLLEGDGNEQPGQEDKSLDEDENDADFEVELEEALESDVEEATGYSTEHSRAQSGEAHVPETRQKKRLKESAKRKKLQLGQSKAALRPILPYMANSQRPPFPAYAWKMPSPNPFSHCSASVSGTDLINGFTACQVGQLYCLIHEHVQLLLQIFSVSVLDPSRQQVANDLLKLISEMIERYEMTLSWRKVPYPLLCFHYSNLHSSVQADSNKTAGCYWTPLIDNNSVLSILDLAPLRLAKNYISDIKEIVSRHKQSYLEDGIAKSRWTKEPLFSLPTPASLDNTSSDFLGPLRTLSAVSPSSSCQLQSDQQQPKKSLAATLVESTMKQSVALVPADIAKLSQRFLHLFNAALFPHKPPAPAVANRVLFTDAEDGLLAMGIMEHNNDWSAIQQHFLPCKSNHQIFVRQKNRSSSKAPENPIKAVRRMKSSPLSEDEKALIYEGLKVFKHDWLSVWKYFVPHRDPSMLPRQWRIATGTQKSYKKTEAVKEKRRLYEAKRRRLKACMTEQHLSKKELCGAQVNYEEDSSDGDMDCDDKVHHVHESFLVDTEAGNSKNINGSNSNPVRLMQYNSSGNGLICASLANDNGELHPETGTEKLLLNSSNSQTDVHSLQQFSSRIKYGASYSISSRHLSSYLVSGTSGGHLVTQSYRARKRKGVRIVKLAPDLPPVNLPPSVRVISQSTFKVYHGDSPHFNGNEGAQKNHAFRVSHVAETGASMMNLIENVCKLPVNHHPCNNSHLDGIIKENAFESDAQLHHPLLFQNPSHFSFNSQSTSPSSFKFLLGSQCSISAAAPEHSRRGLGLPIYPSTIDFHPLFQIPENSTDNHAIVSSFNEPAGDLRSPTKCQCNETNDLDLNIQLPSATDEQIVNEGFSLQNVELNASASEKRIVADLEPSTAIRKTDLSVKPTVFYAKNGFGREADITCNQCLGGSFHEESNPGIVMEQEELSDSEVESEDVVFEYEDLEDSEEEEEELCRDEAQILNKDDEIGAAQDLHQRQQQSSAASQSPVNKRGKGRRMSSQHAKPLRSKDENGRIGSHISFSSPQAARSRKKGDAESSALLDLGAVMVESKVSGCRRSKRRTSIN